MTIHWTHHYRTLIRIDGWELRNGAMFEDFAAPAAKQNELMNDVAEALCDEYGQSMERTMGYNPHDR